MNIHLPPYVHQRYVAQRLPRPHTFSIISSLVNVLFVLTVLSIASPSFADSRTSPQSCGSCEQKGEQSCGEHCDKRNFKNSPREECVDSCVQELCKKPCACRVCRERVAKSCDEECVDQGVSHQQSNGQKEKPGQTEMAQASCLSECLDRKCSSHCPAAIPEEERPAAAW